MNLGLSICCSDYVEVLIIRNVYVFSIRGNEAGTVPPPILPQKNQSSIAWIGGLEFNLGDLEVGVLERMIKCTTDYLLWKYWFWKTESGRSNNPWRLVTIIYSEIFFFFI